MPRYIPISREQHAHCGWQRFTDYRFAAHESVVPIVAAELDYVLTSMPIAFIEEDAKFVPVAVLGLQPRTNLFVNPQGQWLGGYAPSAFRAYPFRMATTPEGKDVLCIDEDSGLLVTKPGEGESFFNADGTPSPALSQVLQFINDTERNRKVTRAACALLQTHGLLQPWGIQIKTDGGEQRIEGLFQINDQALATLGGEALQALRDGGALQLAYAQTLSTARLAVLQNLMELRRQAGGLPISSGGEIDLEFLNNDGTISFGNLS